MVEADELYTPDIVEDYKVAETNSQDCKECAPDFVQLNTRDITRLKGWHKLKKIVFEKTIYDFCYHETNA